MQISNTSNSTDTIDVTIANSGTVSTAASLNGMRLVGIITPAALTGTTLTFQASIDNSTFLAMYDEDGALISTVDSTSDWIVPNFVDFIGIPYRKVVSGSAEGGERTITLVVRPI